MNQTQAQTSPAPPNLIRSLTTGFEAIANHVGLVLFSLVLDIFLWLGPHLRLHQLAERMLGEALALSEAQSPDMIQTFQATRQLWSEVTQNINLFGILRTIPVGIPSLFASEGTGTTPLASMLNWEVPSLGIGISIWAGMTLLGTILGALYYDLVAQAALSGKIDVRQSLSQWNWTGRQTVVLALIWLGILLLISLPAACVAPFVVLSGGNGMSPLLFMAATGLLLWIMFPLLFSAHGIFVNRHPAWLSLRQGARLTRLTMPSTSLFFLAILVISEGLDILWQQPPTSSWLMMIGVIGHAFVTAALLAASFVYYRDADRWLHRLVQQQLLRQAG